MKIIDEMYDSENKQFPYEEISKRTKPFFEKKPFINDDYIDQLRYLDLNNQFAQQYLGNWELDEN